MRLIQSLTKDHFVALQETKMTDEDARLLQLALPTIKVVATPAQSLNNGTSGGVALLIPTYIANHSNAYVIIQSYAILSSTSYLGFEVRESRTTVI